MVWTQTIRLELSRYALVAKDIVTAATNGEVVDRDWRTASTRAEDGVRATDIANHAFGSVDPSNNDAAKTGPDIPDCDGRAGEPSWRTMSALTGWPASTSTDTA